MSNPDADHIGGFLDVFDAFPVETVFVSEDTNSTLTYNTFLRGVRDEGAETEVLRAGMECCWTGEVCGRTRESRNTQPPGLRFRALLTDHSVNESALSGLLRWEPYY